MTRKSRLVAGGHVHKDVQAYATFSSVFSRDSVRIGLLLASLNGLKVLKVLCADIGNAYLNAPCREKIHTICGPDIFGPENEGRIAIICRALYGLKSAGAAWRYHFLQFIEDELGYTNSTADPDVYRKPKLKLDGSKYYSYFIVYVDDILCIDEAPNIEMDRVSQTFLLKDGVSTPTMYLGTNVKHMDIDPSHSTTNQKCWSLGSSSYMKETVKVTTRHMEKT